MTPTDHRFWDIIRENYTPDEVIKLDRQFQTVDINRARYFNLSPAQIARLKWIDSFEYDYQEDE